jgi:hypothetical protein
MNKVKRLYARYVVLCNHTVHTGYDIRHWWYVWVESVKLRLKLVNWVWELSPAH